MSARGKKLHHSVPRFHLRAWAEDEMILCLQDGQIQPRNLKNVCAENYFYRLRPLSQEDVEFLRTAITVNSPKAVQAACEQIVEAFRLPFIVKQRLSDTNNATPETMAEIERLIIELNENAHMHVEERFRPYLRAMIAGNLSFLRDKKSAAEFFWGLLIQYTRTDCTKRMQRSIEPKRLERYKQIANPLAHIVALNAGFSLFLDREILTVMLLDNQTSVPFVTGDQPVINIAANPTVGTPPEKFDLFYPLSPRKALLVLEPGSEFLPGDPCVSETAAHMYNLRMAAHSYRQVLADSSRVLEAVRSDLPAYLSCMQNGLK